MSYKYDWKSQGIHYSINALIIGHMNSIPSWSINLMVGNNYSFLNGTKVNKHINLGRQHWCVVNSNELMIKVMCCMYQTFVPPCNLLRISSCTHSGTSLKLSTKQFHPSFQVCNLYGHYIKYSTKWILFFHLVPKNQTNLDMWLYTWHPMHSYP